MARGVLALVVLGLLVYALTDCAVTPDRRVAGLPKAVWIVLVVVVPVLGPVAWLLASRAAPAEAGDPGAPRRPGPDAPRRPVAPDDDPDFLWRLEQERRRRARGDQNGDRPS